MQRILIVDDEFLVRLGLKTTIDWEKYGYEIIGEASNGKEALEMARTLLPDIVMTDIKMPAMDGIELITKIKEENSHTQFVILSNHENFQYAKQAVKLGVSQYILKSEINKEFLLQSLKSIGQNRKAETSKSQDRHNLEEAYLKKNLHKTNVNDCNSAARISQPSVNTFVEPKYIMIKYWCNISIMNEQSFDMLSKIMTSLVDTLFPGSVLSEAVYYIQYCMTVICPVANMGEDIEQTILEKSNAIGRKLKHYLSVDLKGGFSHYGARGEIPYMFMEAELARQKTFFVESPFHFYRKEYEEWKNEIRPHVSGSTIIYYLTHREYDELHTYVKDIFDELKRIQSYLYVERCFFDFLSIVGSSLDKINISPASSVVNKLDHDNLYSLASIEQIENYICDMFAMILQESGSGESGYSVNVKKSIAYLEENFASNITLEEVAQYVEISKSYLSMLFKQETGTNLVTYLNRYRIEKAKEILVSTNFKIYEVAEKVGFCSPYYFSKMFKEITKMQCKEYKDKFFKGNKQQIR